MSPHSLCKVIPFSHFILCIFTDSSILRPSFFSCAWAGGLARDLPKPPPRRLVWSLILHPASAPHQYCSSRPAHIFLPVSCCKLLPPPPQKPSVKFKPSFHISEALLFLNFTVNSFSLYFFSWFYWDLFLFWSTFNPVWIASKFLQYHTKKTAFSLQGTKKITETGEAPCNFTHTPGQGWGSVFFLEAPSSWPHSKSWLR